MTEIIVVGLGPGQLKHLTQEARDWLLSEHELYFRESGHPVYHWLRDQGRDIVSFDPIYSLPGVTYEKVYQTIVKTLVKAAKAKGRVVYAIPGHPWVFEKTPRWLKKSGAGEGVEIKVVPGMSFIEAMYNVLEIDPEEGLQIINGFNFGFYGGYPFTEKLGLIIGQVGFPTESDPDGKDSNADAVANALLEKFPPDHKVTLVWSSGMPEFKMLTRTFALSEFPEQAGFDRSLASLYVPPIKPPWEWVKGKKK